MPVINISPVANGYLNQAQVVPIRIPPIPAYAVVLDPPGSPDDTNYIWVQNGLTLDAFLFADYPFDDGDVALNFLDVTYRFLFNSGPLENHHRGRPFVRKSGINYFGDLVIDGPNPKIHRWAVRPWDGFPWKPSDLKNSVLEGGIELDAGLQASASCSQIYMAPDHVVIGKPFTPVSTFVDHNVESVLNEAVLAVSLKEDLVSSLVEPQLSVAHKDHDLSVKLVENVTVELT